MTSWEGGQTDEIPRGSPWPTVALLITLACALAAVMLASR